MRETVDQRQVRLAGPQRGGQGFALGIGNDRVVAAVDEDEAGFEGLEVARGEVERRDVGPDIRWQRVDQRPRPLRLAVVEEAHHRAAFGAEIGLEILDRGVEIGELAPGHGRERDTVKATLDPLDIGQHEDPFAVFVGPRRAPLFVRAATKISGREERHHAAQVVVAADRNHEVDAEAEFRLDERDHGGPDRVGDRGDADAVGRLALGPAGQIANRGGDRGGRGGAGALGAEVR